MEDYGERQCRTMLTIEKRLGKYAGEKEEERNEILWYVWQQNKRWLSNILDWVMLSFPNYSRHDKSHALSVLHNIEMILGECQVMKLSATDCFMILHVVFLHDIGMCVTAADKADLMKSPQFIHFLEEYRDSGNAQNQKYARLLLKYCEELGVEKRMEDILQVKLDMFYAMIYLVADYVRREHAQDSRKLLEEWMSKSDKMGLGHGFTYSGIPRRLFHMVGACACVHNSSGFKDVMALPMVDNGFSHDYIHPRFIAVLLQLGDSLDIDNDRFHPLVGEVMGDLPPDSEIHFEKHKAIRRLRISSSKITIAADCSSSEVLRLIHRECTEIRNILQYATYHWAAICPEEMDARLPNFEPVELQMNGKQISERLVNAEFKIQQKKAFNFLQGSNFYKDEKFVFLRELFQNAVDASKMQYWIDWCGSRWNQSAMRDGEEKEWSISEMGRKLPPLAYPIEVEFHLARRQKKNENIILLDKQADVSEGIVENEDIEYGVLVRVIDHGIGMSQEDIYAIADVGTSYEKNEKRRKGMPSWLLPTAEFGIGLQSVFLITDSFTAYTHTHSGERYKIVFWATGDKGSSQIHVTPQEEGEMMEYGTKVEVFVPYTKKKKHQQELKSWSGRDPFSADYVKDRPLRHARELAVQLVVSLDNMIGERLFPVEVRLYDHADQKEKIYDRMLSGEITKLNYRIFLDNEEVKKEKHEDPTLEAMEEYVAWAFHRNRKDTDMVVGSYEQIDYMIDCRNMKLYLFDHGNHDVYARFGADRLQQIWDHVRKYLQDEVENGTQIFYKGIFVEYQKWKKDANLLEYIDIKEKIDRKYLRLNRCELTFQGQQYLEQEIYPKVLEAAKKVLVHCERKTVIENIKKQLNVLQEKNDRISEEENVSQIQNLILAAAGLAVLVQIRNKDYWVSQEEKNAAQCWNQLLKDISNVIEEAKKNGKRWASSSMFQIEVEELQKQSPNYTSSTKQVNIAEILDHNNKYAIMSVRRSKERSWKEFLIRLNPVGDESKEVSEPLEGRDSGDEREKKDTSQDGSVLDQIMAAVGKLEKEQSWEKRKEILAGVENVGDQLFEVCKNITFKDRDKQLSEGKTDRILKWLIYNMPSTAIFFSNDTNLRINFLGLEYSDTLYLNRHMRRAIWEKMHKIYEERKIERFSTIVPCGYSGLAIRDKEKSVFYVKRGLFLYMERPYIINPFRGDVLIEGGNQVSELNRKLYGRGNFWSRYQAYIIKLMKARKEISEKDVYQDIAEDKETLDINRHRDYWYEELEDTWEDEQSDQAGGEQCFDKDFLKKALLYYQGKLSEEETKEIKQQLKGQLIPVKSSTIGSNERDRNNYLDTLRDEYYKKLYNIMCEACGYECDENREDNSTKEGMDNSAKTQERLLEYIKEKNNIRITKEERLSLYMLYLEEWMYLLCWSTCDKYVPSMNTEDF